MALLRILKNGQRFGELTLHSGKEWIVGRASSCDFVLEGEQGISRQHFKLFQQNGHWMVEVLSRYGELYQDGKKVGVLTLSEQMRFEVPPFEFVFEDSAHESEAAENTAISQVRLASAGERTYVGRLSAVPFLRVCNENDETVQLFQLEGQAWIAGRDVSCSLFIDNPQFSRRHFEIRHEEGVYLVKDLESSNGTLINDEPISTTTWTQLKSGDVLTVVDWSIHFELRDPLFEDKLKEIPQEFQQPLLVPTATPMDGFQTTEFQETFAQPQPGPPHLNHGAVSSRKNPNIVRLLIAVLAVGGLLAYFLQDDGAKPGGPVSSAKGKAGNAFDKLTPQQQQYVRDTYRLADRLFKEGRYEMSRQEVAKIHQLVPSFEESKNLEKLAEIAIQTQVEQQKAEAREREKAEMEEKIQRTVAECTKKINSNIEMQTIDDCLSPVIPLNPDHPAILSLKAKVDQLIAERTAREERRAEYRGKVHRQKHLYETAENFLQDGKPLEAIQAFEHVVKSRLPDPMKLKVEAKRQIASIQKQLTEQQAELEKEADQSYKKGDLKSTILTLQKALSINPENETLKGRVNSMLSELRKQMQALYQEGVLEESVGEVDTAKAKWKKIVESSLPDEDYYKKAKMKLKKYGIE